MFKEIKKNKKLYMLIVDQIKTLIDEGTIKIGDKLPPERELSAQFGLSRSTVREALTALEIMGLVEVQSGLGTFVAMKKTNEENIMESLTIEDGISPTEIFVARLIIEPQLARLAAQKATIEDLDEMKSIIDQSNALKDEEIEAFELLDEQFHLLIAKATYNEVLYRIAESINKLRNSRLWGNMKWKSLQKKGRIHNYKHEHMQIYEALKNRKPKEAEMITKKHLNDIRNHIFEETD